ncbi:histidine phosphatase family protein [Salinarimonas ramus]|uniref:Phosphoglycerate mutase n=1 Tax=Salinarimonas ramus TaxID=690164 RepID=A0A917V4W5_9HYPH|nr:histidine phosphatase family protein [Salinarimonas ramus]GGK38106.1 phosphoglycerate mutase [Salinarimonas ramus]
MSLLLHLVRHGAHDGAPGSLAGRDPSIHLSDAGRREVDALAATLPGARLARIVSSPQPRTVETAEILAAGHGIAIDAALDEIDFGPWAGRTFTDLEADPSWRRWNVARDEAATLAGETMANVARRVESLVADLVADHGEKAEVALVTHCDVIRAVLCRALQRPFQALFAIDIDTASRTTLSLDADGTRVLVVNHRPTFAERETLREAVA